MKYGIQMYSLRDITGNDMAGALRAVAEMGYSFVEFAGFFNIPAKEMKAMLDEYGLTCSSTHSGLGGLITPEAYAASVEYHHIIGCDKYIIPGHDLSSQAKLDDFIKAVNELQPKLEAEGLSLGYHNHSHEFIANRDGTLIHQQLEDKTNIRFQIDTYWAFNAKTDPVQVITRLKDRIDLIHLKDGNENGEGFSLGSGCAPVAAVRNAAIDLGFGMVVESETCRPTGVEEVKRCIDYLKSLDAADGR